MNRPSPRVGLAATSMAVAVGIVAWNLGNFVFFVLAGHVLGPEDYGFVVALLAIAVAVFIPLTALQAASARPFAVDATEASALVRRGVVASSLGGAALLIGAVGVMAVIDAVADIPVTALTLTLLAVLPMAPLFLLLGVLQGTSRFWSIAIVLAVWGGIRPLLLLGLSLVLENVDATLTANVLGTLAALAVAWAFTAGRLAGGTVPSDDAWRVFRSSLIGPIFGMCGLAVLFNLDVVVASIRLDALESGYFAAVAVLAKAGVLLAPQILGITLLPRVARRTSAHESTGEYAVFMVIVTVTIGAAGTLFTALIPDEILRIFGSDFTPGAWILSPAIAALIPLAVVVALVNFQIARSDDRFPKSLVAVAAVSAVALIAVGTSVEAILITEAVLCTAAIGLHEWLYRRDEGSLRSGFARVVRRVRSRPPQPEA